MSWWYASCLHKLNMISWHSFIGHLWLHETLTDEVNFEYFQRNVAKSIECCTSYEDNLCANIFISVRFLVIIPCSTITFYWVTFPSFWDSILSIPDSLIRSQTFLKYNSNFSYTFYRVFQCHSTWEYIKILLFKVQFFSSFFTHMKNKFCLSKSLFIEI